MHLSPCPIQSKSLEDLIQVPIAVPGGTHPPGWEKATSSPSPEEAVEGKEAESQANLPEAQGVKWGQ